MLRIQGAGAELGDGVPVDHLGQILVVPHGDAADLVRGAETVEEVQNRHAALDGGQVGDGAQIHGLLGVGGGDHGVAGLTTCHHVGVVAEDAQGMGGQRTGGDVDDTGHQLAGDLVHVRDHQQQALRSGVGGGQSAGGDGTVNSAGRAALGLPFSDLNGLAEDVLQTVSGPFVGQLCHDRRRGDRVDRGDFRKGIGYGGGSSIAVHGFQFTSHVLFLLYVFPDRSFPI